MGGAGFEGRRGGVSAREARESGGRATDATFMGLMYIIATQMSTGYLDFSFCGEEPIVHWLSEHIEDAADEGFGFLGRGAARAV